MFDREPDINKLKMKKDIKGLVETLTYKKSHLIRVKAATALGELNAAQAVDLLLQSLNDEAHEVGEAAAKALARIESPKVAPGLIKAAQSPSLSPYVIGAVIEVMGEMRDEKSVDFLITLLKDNEKEWYHLSVIEAIGKTRSRKAMTVLEKMLTSTDKHKRLATITAFEKIDLKKSIPLLLSALKDNDKEVRTAVVSSFKKAVVPETVPAFIELLGDEDQAIRHHAVTALVQSEDPRATIPLINIYENVGKNMRQQIRGTLKRIKEKSNENEDIQRAVSEFLDDILRPTITEFNSDEKQTRLKALNKFMEIGDSTVKKYVFQALKDSDEEICQKATSFIQQKRWQPETMEQTVYYAIALNDKSKILELGKSAIEIFLQDMPHANVDTRRMVMRSLANMDDSQSITVILKTLENETDRYVQSYGGDALKNWKEKNTAFVVDDNFIKQLINLAKNSENTAIKKNAVELMLKFAGYEYADLILDTIFTVPDLELDVDYLKILFHDYSWFILNIMKPYKCEKKYDNQVSGPRDWEEWTSTTVNTYDLSEYMRTVEELCRINSPITNNLLHKIKNQPVIGVIKEEYHSSTSPKPFLEYAVLNYTQTRETAAIELAKRGEPPYEPKLYLISDNWRNYKV